MAARFSCYFPIVLFFSALPCPPSPSSQALELLAVQKTAYMLLSSLSFGYPKQKTATEWTSGDETQAGARRNPPKDKTTSSKSIINFEWGI